MTVGCARRISIGLMDSLWSHCVIGRRAFEVTARHRHGYCYL